MRFVAHRFFDAVAELAHEHLGVELDVVEHLANRVALDDRLEHDVARRVEADVHRVRVAEQVVEVAEDLLIRADEEDAQCSTARR